MSRRPDDLIRLSEAEADRLARLYMEAEREILIQLDRAMARGNDLSYLRGMLDNVQAILEDLLTGNRQWCEQAIPRVYVEAAKFADEAVGKAGGGFGAVHQQAAKVLADNTFDRLESVRQVIGRRVEDVYRRYALEATRQSIIGYKTWKQVSGEFRDNLRAEGITGFRDAAGRDWNMKTYAEMVARTTTMEAHLTGTANRLLEHGYDLVVVSSHAGSCEKCEPWQGKVLSLTGKTPGYPTLEEAKAAGLFHPNCRHAYSISIDIDAEIESLERETEEGQQPESTSAMPGDSGTNIPVPSIAEAAKAGVEQALSEALAHGLKTNSECLLALDANTGKALYNKITGTSEQVIFPQKLIDLLDTAGERSIVLVHNHPRSSAFSDDDVVQLSRRTVFGLFLVGQDGTRYYAGKIGSGVPSAPRIRADYQKYRTKYYGYYRNLVQLGKMTPEDAWREHSHKILVDMAKSLGFEYVRWNEP